MYQRYMYRADIQRIIDKNAGFGTFARFVSNPITDASVTAVLKKAKFLNTWTFAATALSWGVADLMNRNQSWWTDSVAKITDYQIRCVRVTHIRNTASSYPAAYLIIERL